MQPWSDTALRPEYALCDTTMLTHDWHSNSNAAAEGSKGAPTSGSTKQLAGLGRAVGIWSRASGKLFSLEARIKDQVRLNKQMLHVAASPCCC
jgi:hypothetical protein